MARSTCDGDAYIHNLAVFIRTHERQLANALVAYKKLSRKQKREKESLATTTANNDNNNNNNNTQDKQLNGLSREIIEENSKSFDDSLTAEVTKPVRLSLSLHHLYFILERFQELGFTVGPMNLRLDNIDAESSNNYVSFLSEFSHGKKLQSDTQSIHSMSSVKSVMSSVSALWSTLGLSSTKGENISSDLRYLYSAFTKLPCLRLANEPNAKLIEGHEEYPFETATPVKVFKNIVILEISELEPKEVFGWDFLAEKLRHLTIKKTNIVDPFEILVELVTSDAKIANNSTSDEGKNNNNTNESEPSSPIQTISSSSTSISLNGNSSVLQPYPAGQPNSLVKKSTSPSLVSTPFYPNYHHIPSYYHHHNYQSGYHHNNSYNHSLNLNHDNLSNTQLLMSSSPSAYHNRGYITEEINNTTPLSSTRRSHYYYKPNSRRGRGGSSTTQDNKSAEDYNESKHNLESLDASKDLSSLLTKPSDLEGDTQTKLHCIDSTTYWKPLKKLSLVENKIERISNNSFDQLSGLLSLDLSYNNLTFIPEIALSKLVNLRSLNLSYNKLFTTRSFPKGLNKLLSVNLRGNKLTDLTSIDNIPAMENIDLRNNRINSAKDLKPLFIINKLSEKVLIKNLMLLGNPIASSRGYRIEIFNLFNGVDINNTVKIDGYGPGILESRMLLDEKTARMKFKNFIDESIISKMTASVSNMNLSSVVKMKTTTTTAPSNATTPKSRTSFALPLSPIPRENSDETSLSGPAVDVLATNNNIINTQTTNNELMTAKTTPVRMGSHLSYGSGTITPDYIPKDSHSASKAGTPNSTTTITRGITNTTSGFLPPQLGILNNSSMKSSEDLRAASTSSNVNFNSRTNSMVVSRRASQETTTTVGTTSANSNPIQRLSLASPALPIITQATTTTVVANNEPIIDNVSISSVSKMKTSLSSIKSSRSSTSIVDKGKSHGVAANGEDFTAGLKINVT